MSTVCVQGLGFVGAANAVAIALARAEHGAPCHRVFGLDAPTEEGTARAASLHAGRFPFPTSDRSLLSAMEVVHRAGNLTAGTNPGVLGEADVIVVDIGVDIDKGTEPPEFAQGPFQAALQTVGAHMRPDALVLLESTVPPGACERIVAPLLRRSLDKRGFPDAEVRLAYCYERIMPGEEYLSSIVDMWRVYAGLTPAAADAAGRFLTSFLSPERPPRRVASIRAAEMAKVLENTYRAVNIALIDEWERFASRIGVDLFEVLEAIRIRPTHRNIRYPGLGVGGYCLTKDPLFGPAAARGIFDAQGLSFPLSEAGVRINDSMPGVSIGRIESMVPGGLKSSRILLLGASYRPDVGDTRHSASSVLLRGLQDRGAVVEVVDPLVEALSDPGVCLHRTLPAANGYDVVVLTVAHRAFRETNFQLWAGDCRPAIFDTNGVLTRSVLEELRDAGFRVGAIGRGDL